MELLDSLNGPDTSYVSTGTLPPTDLTARLVTEAHERFGSVTSGQNSQVYPALANVPPDLFGICVAGADGRIFAVGDAEHEFTIMSVSKPYSLDCKTVCTFKLQSSC